MQNDGYGFRLRCFDAFTRNKSRGGIPAPHLGWVTELCLPPEVVAKG